MARKRLSKKIVGAKRQWRDVDRGYFDRPKTMMIDGRKFDVLHAHALKVDAVRARDLVKVKGYSDHMGPGTYVIPRYVRLKQIKNDRPNSKAKWVWLVLVSGVKQRISRGSLKEQGSYYKPFPKLRGTRRIW